MSKAYVGDVGTRLVVDTGVDISAATTVELIITKPGSLVAAPVEVTKTGTIYDTTKIVYAVESGVFSVAGRYLIQAHVHLPTWSGLGDTASLYVYEPGQ